MIKKKTRLYRANFLILKKSENVIIKIIMIENRNKNWLYRDEFFFDHYYFYNYIFTKIFFLKLKHCYFIITFFFHQNSQKYNNISVRERRCYYEQNELL